MAHYLQVRYKYGLALLFASSWAGISIWLSVPWLYDLATHTGLPLAFFFISFIAIAPGFINSFVVSSLLLDRRPLAKTVSHFPDVTVLVPAYNEGEGIRDTLVSLMNQEYDGNITVIAINDGSSDDTLSNISILQKEYPQIRLLNIPVNGGKSHALNQGLELCETELVISVDADSWVKRDGIRNIVARYLSDPPTTRAVAGTILIRNSRETWITKAQEWDYFLGIGAIKRIQSLYQGTLVAQGAFSLYDAATLRSVGGWPDTVGEDIVLTWKLLLAGHRVGHAENACCFTTAPATLRQFMRQRQRWSRGLIEAFKANPGLLVKPRLTVLYIWWNLLFPLMDLAYTFGFLPGVVLALFGRLWIVGPMTLALIPPSMLLNRVMYNAGKRMFEGEHLVVRQNRGGMILYILVYGIILQPACVWGYLSELLNLKKSWGTK